MWPAGETGMLSSLILWEGCSIPCTEVKVLKCNGKFCKCFGKCFNGGNLAKFWSKSIFSVNNTCLNDITILEGEKKNWFSQYDTLFIL